MADRATKDGAEVDGASVLVVVPTLNEAAHIKACLMSILEGTVSLSKSSLVVVDGGSHDKTRKIVRRLAERHPQISLVDNPQRLQSAGINRAVERYARGEHRVLIRCDAHAIYPADYIERLTARLTQTGAASVVTVMDATGETPFARAAAWIVDTPLGSGGSAHRGGRFPDLLTTGIMRRLIYPHFATWVATTQPFRITRMPSWMFGWRSLAGRYGSMRP